jgi:hypothetical protein
MNAQQTIRSFAAAVAFAALAIPAAASADGMPSYASGAGETIHGTISSVPGKYDVYVRDDRGFTDHVALHDGTVINPTGITLGSGQTVTITGHNAGSVFRADEIDTPYGGDPATYGDAPSAYPAYGYAYAPYPYAYGYPGYGYGYGYPYGVSLGFYFGGGYGRYGYGPYRGGGFYGHGYYGHGYSGHGYSGPGSNRGGYGRGSYGAPVSHGSSGRTGSISHSSGGSTRGGGGGHR